MSDIPRHYTTEFAANWDHLVQQTLSKTRECVMVEAVEGKEKSFSQFGAVEMQRVSQRAGQTRITDVPTGKRWLRPYPLDTAAIFDEWDEAFLGEVVLPTSATVVAHANAYNRAVDRTIIESAIGTNYTGDSGLEPVVLPAGQTVRVGYVDSGADVNSGLTVAKLRQAKFILDNNEADDDGRYLAYTAKQLQDLLRSVEIGSYDYNDIKALVDGKVEKFMGFTFKRVSSLIMPIDDLTGVRTCVFWHKSGIKLADSGRTTHIDVRPDLSHALQIRSVAALGGTRTEEKKVGIIYCDEVL